MTGHGWQPPEVLLAVDLVVLTLRESRLQVLLVERGIDPYRGTLALPGGFLGDRDEELVAAARRELAEEAGLSVDSFHLEQLGVYGDPGRDPRGRVISVAYLAILPRLPDPVAGTDAAGAAWHPVDLALSPTTALAFDHRRIVADGLERARGRLERTTLATAFCGPTFTLSELHQVYEAVWGMPLDQRNFYRKVQGADKFVLPAGPPRKPATGRPARLFQAGPRRTLHPPMVRPSEPANHEGADPLTNRPIVVLTALDLEYEAVREKLLDLRPHVHDRGTHFEVGRLADSKRRIVLALVGKGNHSAAVLAERAIAEFTPAALLFVGVAGALHSHLQLGDVVVATHVYAYHGGTSEDDGLKGRPRVWETSHRAEQTARHLARRRPDIPVHFGPIAAGEVVLNSTTSGEARWVREHYNDAMAIEMEGAGVAQAAHLNGALPVIVIRGISDKADGTKEISDRARWQPTAVANAATFAAALAAELPVEAASSQPHTTTGKPRSRQMSETTRNTARDNAWVGVQAGRVYGDITVGAEPTTAGSLADQLADFRAHVRQAHAAGQLDEDSYAETETQLGHAEEQLQSGNRRKLFLTLRKVLGLVTDVSELVSRLMVIINALKAVS